MADPGFPRRGHQSLYLANFSLAPPRSANAAAGNYQKTQSWVVGESDLLSHSLSFLGVDKESQIHKSFGICAGLTFTIDLISMFIDHTLITDRVRSTRGGNSFTLLVCPHLGGGTRPGPGPGGVGGVPGQVQVGGTWPGPDEKGVPSQFWMQVWGYPDRVPPSQVYMGGYLARS